jgi:hypothetical protein
MKNNKNNSTRASLATRILCWVLVFMMLAGALTTIAWGLQTLFT